MRNSLSRNLISLAKAGTKNALLLTGDHGYALFDEFRKDCGSQYLNAGIAEQNMIGVGAGLSKTGFYPMMYGLSAFLPIRVLEQIKLDFCYENLPGLFLGDGAGVVYSALGASHQSTEDISALRAVPHIQIFSPADALEMDAVFEFIARRDAPVYLRVGKSDLETIHTTKPTITLGRPLNIRSGNGKIAFVATGSMVSVARRLAETQFKDAAVWSVPCLKPFDAEYFKSTFKDHQQIITLEEHSIQGGLGSIVCETIAEISGPRVHRLGINDRFSKFCGSYQYLIKEHGLDDATLIEKIRKILG